MADAVSYPPTDTNRYVMVLCTPSLKRWGAALCAEHVSNIATYQSVCSDAVCSKGMNEMENFQWLLVPGPKWEEVAGGWRKLRGKELRNLYVSPNVMRVIKSRRMKLTGYIATWER
jgi:hypothetical protein